MPQGALRGGRASTWDMPGINNKDYVLQGSAPFEPRPPLAYGLFDDMLLLGFRTDCAKQAFFVVVQERRYPAVSASTLLPRKPMYQIRIQSSMQKTLFLTLPLHESLELRLGPVCNRKSH